MSDRSITVIYHDISLTVLYVAIVECFKFTKLMAWVLSSFFWASIMVL